MKLIKNFDSNMGEDIVDYLELWDYEKFNLFEGNIEKINQSIFTQDIGIKKTFYPNGMFIKYDELNGLEKHVKNERYY